MERQAYEKADNIHVATTTIRGKANLVISALEHIIKKDHQCIYTNIGFTIVEGLKLSPSCRSYPTVTLSSVFQSDDDYLPLWLDAFCVTISKLLRELEVDDEAIIFYDGDALRVTPYENQQAP